MVEKAEGIREKNKGRRSVGKDERIREKNKGRSI